MSGGHLADGEYPFFRFEDYALDIENEIRRNQSTGVDRYGDPISRGYPEKIMQFMQQLADDLRSVGKRYKALDWLYAGDTGSDTFIKRMENGELE